MILTREDYYSTDYVIFNIISQLKNRYLSVRRRDKKKENKWILSRYYMGYSKQLFLDSLRRNEVFQDQSAKIYFDLAQWKNEEGITPIFSFEKNKRAIEKREFSGDPGKNNGAYLKLISSYSFAIDIDSKSPKKAYKDAKAVKLIMDKYKLPYSLKFSGSKGFHFVIDSQFIELGVKPIDLPGLFGKVVNNLMNDERIKTIDTSIYDARRILKIAYSLCNNDGKEYVCLPLSDEEFDNWKYEDMEMSRVLAKVKLFKRGLLTRLYGLTEEQLKMNFKKFIEDYK
jgi:hypothetical protein